MRIVLLTNTYPPASTDGIPRQRQILATELARRGHAVIVITFGATRRLEQQDNVAVHTLPAPGLNKFSATYPAVDIPLSYSQALYEALTQLVASQPVDVVDVPLWAAQGLVTLQNYAGPVVLWLQTSSAQLAAIHGHKLAAGERAQVELEQWCLNRASAWLADSRAALEVARGTGVPNQARIAAVVPLGLPPLADEPSVRPADECIEALVVGRLERRKGTPGLLEHLPDWLASNPRVRVRFVGRDNSVGDGWLQKHGLDYPSSFRKQHPELEPRVIFDGYVSEAQLGQCYAQSDLVLVPSLYESFGLVYLEAMRAGRPLVTFAVGAALEVFPNGRDDGALLAPAGDWMALLNHSTWLVNQPDQRAQIGRQGYLRFSRTFSAAAMAEGTLAFYKQALDQTKPAQSQVCAVYQVMEALDEGDAVSAIARRGAALLADLGQPREIISRFAHPAVLADIRPLDSAPPPTDSALIFHYWGYNTSTALLDTVRGPKALYFHNITPPNYFSLDTEAYRSTKQGYEQLGRLVQVCDLLIGVSSYNLQTLRPFVTTAKPGLVVPPVIDADELRSAAYDQALLAQLRQPGVVNWLFVGRIARNKRPDRLMRLFDYYYRQINRHARLWLVGNTSGDPYYLSELEQLRAELPAGLRIVLTGKVSDQAVRAYYRAADVFVSASEHEGFGMPLIEAMVFDVPVLAFQAAAVPETLGPAGILVQAWDTPRLAELVHLVTNYPALHNRVVAGQRAHLARFTADAVRPYWADILLFLTRGDIPNGISWVKPAADEASC